MKRGGEEARQMWLMNWLQFNYPEIWTVTHHSPNGGFRHKKVAEELKAMGVKRGFPDLVTFEPRIECKNNAHWQGLAIELKKSKSDSLSKEQMVWGSQLVLCGFLWHPCHSLDEAKRMYRVWASFKKVND